MHKVVRGPPAMTNPHEFRAGSSFAFDRGSSQRRGNCRISGSAGGPSAHSDGRDGGRKHCASPLATQYVQDPHISESSSLAAASFSRCPACPEHRVARAELALCRLRSNGACHLRVAHCLRDLMPFRPPTSERFNCAWRPNRIAPVRPPRT
jgi:hypothetical protein